MLRVSSQTIGCQSAVAKDETRSADPSLALLARDDGLAVKRERPTWHMAQAGRVEPLRSDDGGDALWRVPSVPGPCTTSSCVERSIRELARPAERHSDQLLLSDARSRHPRAAHAARGADRPLRTRPHRADERAPARGEPVLAGVPWGFGVEMDACGHVIVSASGCVPS